MATDSRQPWVLAGYDLFASGGPQGLKVEVLARRVGKSKSSFYHHFADLDVFTEFLLAHHLTQARQLAELERTCQQVVPDLLNVLIDARQDLLFSRQLRIHRAVGAYRHCFEKANEAIGDGILPIWAASMGLANSHDLARMILRVALDNFFAQLTVETLSFEWLLGFVQQMQGLVRAFKHNQQREALYGSV